jgi:hypothetical protein
LLFCYGARKERKGENEHNIHLSSFWEDTAAAANKQTTTTQNTNPNISASSFFLFLSYRVYTRHLQHFRLKKALDTN